MSDERKMLTCPEHGTEYAEKVEGVTIGECPWCLQRERDEAMLRRGDILAGCDIERGEKLYRQVEVVRGPGKTVDKIESEKLQAKVEYAREFGLIVDIAKSSDCPEGKLAGATREGSELERLERGIADLIEAEAEVEKVKEREKGLEAIIEILLQVLPDNDRFKDEDPSWGRAWDELSAEAQLHVKSVRTVSQAIHDRKKIFFQSAVPGLMADLPNANGHIYPIEVVRKAVDDFQTKIEERKALIYVEPEDPEHPQLLEAGGVLTQLWVEGGVVYAKGHAIQTPAGAKLTSLIQFQHPGIFSAGKGSMKGNEVQDDFQINHFSIGSGHVPGGEIELKLLPEEDEGEKEDKR